MRNTSSILYKSEYRINDNIAINIPKVGDVIDSEEEYYGFVSMLTAMPIDMMVQLSDVGIDFAEIDEYQLFTITFESIKNEDLSMIFKDLDTSKFELAINSENDEVVFVDRENDIVIDRSIYTMIADCLREIHHLEKDTRRPANKEAREFMISRARKKQMRLKNKKHKSYIEPLIISMVNTEQFKYDFEGTRELSLYQFNESVRQIIKKTDYDNRMYGVYTGNISLKDLSQDDLNWLVNK